MSKKYMSKIFSKSLSLVKRTFRHGSRHSYDKKKALAATENMFPRCVHTDPAFIPPAHIKEMLKNSAIKVVSFDIFDTLLVRPALQPKDIFHLVARKVDPVFGLDFISLRWDAEAQLGQLNATILEIYEYIAHRHRLDKNTMEALMEEEIHCEATLLSPRPDMKELYDEAVRLGKRVIAISDMYIPGTFLQEILRQKHCPMDAVYVSCDHQARKSDGGLYDIMLTAEGAHPSEILHIGDNWHSDYLEAVKKKLIAVWVPSIHTRCFPDQCMVETLFGEAVHRDPLWSIFLGFSLNRLYGKWSQAPANITHLDDLRHFTQMVVAPLLTAFCLFLASDKSIRSTYKSIYFASRDGWLPYRVYESIRQRLDGLPGIYFAAGRRAYFPFLYDSFFDFAEALPVSGDADVYSMRNFMETYFAGTPLLSVLEKNLSAEEKALLFFHNRKQCLGILRRFESEIATCMDQRRARIRAYYESIFAPSEARHLVFDLGYSGSVGKALHAATGKPVDKVYFWEEPGNKKLDSELGTHTRVYMKNQSYAPYHLILEELFSPCEGGVIDFDEQLRPCREMACFSEEHKNDLASVHATCLEYTQDFCALLGEYAPYAGALSAPGAATDMCKMLFRDAPYCNLTLFQNIVFADPIYRCQTISLEKKLESGIERPTVFSGTSFSNPNKVFHRILPVQGHPAIGMHLHLYHMHMSHEIIRYLQCFPAPFDLYITLADPSLIPTVRNMFSGALLPHAQAVHIVEVPNRGRDVAPWVLGMRPYQDGYDLFCHFHTKESQHIGFGDEWRTYLFDNLFRPDIATEIINIFTAYPNVGCLFPAIHPKVRHVMIDVKTPLYGSEHEYGLICDMLDRMGLGGQFHLSDLFFSVGTMLWYRPQALRQLFTFDLSLDEFAEEPIGVGGTLAHAMERLPAVIAMRNGYTAENLTRYPAR